MGADPDAQARESSKDETDSSVDPKAEGTEGLTPDEDGDESRPIARSSMPKPSRKKFQGPRLVGRVTNCRSRAFTRVFAISFPNRSKRLSFFEDARYLEVRRTFFEPAVAHAYSIATEG